MIFLYKLDKIYLLYVVVKMVSINKLVVIIVNLVLRGVILGKLNYIATPYPKYLIGL